MPHLEVVLVGLSSGLVRICKFIRGWRRRRGALVRRGVCAQFGKNTVIIVIVVIVALFSGTYLIFA
jgi:hypothetical protein